MRSRRVILADVGWNGTIQLLLEQLAQLAGKNVAVEGIYLGRTGTNVFGMETGRRLRGILFDTMWESDGKALLVEEIWEYILTYQFPVEPNGLPGKVRSTLLKLVNPSPKRDERNATIWQGIDDFIDAYQTPSQIDPEMLYFVCRKNLLRLFTRPTRREVLLLGTVMHDAGLGSKVARPIVDLHFSRRQILTMLIRRPLQLRNFVAGQYWINGFLSWYQLHVLKPIQLLRQFLPPR